MNSLQDFGESPHLSYSFRWGIKEKTYLLHNKGKGAELHSFK